MGMGDAGVKFAGVQRVVRLETYRIRSSQAALFIVSPSLRSSLGSTHEDSNSHPEAVVFPGIQTYSKRILQCATITISRSINQ
jgi:hypothetical protein